jgi:hypothetical protein
LHDIEKKLILSLYLLKIHIIPDLTLLLLEVPTALATFPVASMTLLLDVPTTVAVSIVPDPAARMESSVEAVATNIHHL